MQHSTVHSMTLFLYFGAFLCCFENQSTDDFLWKDFIALWKLHKYQYIETIVAITKSYIKAMKKCCIIIIIKCNGMQIIVLNWKNHWQIKIKIKNWIYNFLFEVTV